MANPRALECPFAAGISDARQARLFQSTSTMVGVISEGSGATVATRASSCAGSPTMKSMPSGSAISLVMNEPGLWPLTRRMTSPTSQPKVNAWYSWREPGGQAGVVAASVDTMCSQSNIGAPRVPSGIASRPASCVSR